MILTKESKDLSLLISKLSFGEYEMPFEDYLILEGEDIIEVGYCMSKFVDIALGHRIEPPSFDFNKEILDSLDVHERPPPIMKHICSSSSIISLHFLPDNPLEFALATL